LNLHNSDKPNFSCKVVWEHGTSHSPQASHLNLAIAVLHQQWARRSLLWEDVLTKSKLMTWHSSIPVRHSFALHRLPFIHTSPPPIITQFRLRDLALKSWTKPKPKGVSPTPRSGHTAVVHDNKIYVFGGETASGPSAEHFALDTGTQISFIFMKYIHHYSVIIFLIHSSIVS